MVRVTVLSSLPDLLAIRHRGRISAETVFIRMAVNRLVAGDRRRIRKGRNNGGGGKRRAHPTVECGRTALWCRRSAEFLGESDEKSFRPANVAEPIRVFILDYFAYELRAALAEPLERPVDVVHREHDA